MIDMMLLKNLIFILALLNMKVNPQHHAVIIGIVWVTKCIEKNTGIFIKEMTVHNIKELPPKKQSPQIME